MKSSVISIKVFALYVVATGLGLMLIPNIWLAPLGFPPAEDFWVRVLGLVAFVLGYYYWTSALTINRSFFTASIYGRCLFGAGTVGLVVIAAAPWQLIILGAVDVAGAIWTKLAMQAEANAT